MSELNYNSEAYVEWMLSQMMDGELDEAQTKHLIHLLFIHPGLQARWRHWHLVREAMQNDSVLLSSKKTEKNNTQNVSNG